MEAEGRALREVNTRGPSGASRTSSGGSKSDLLTYGRHGTERDCAYAYGRKEPAKSAYLERDRDEERTECESSCDEGKDPESSLSEWRLR